jgi:hypothetical protein
MVKSSPEQAMETQDGVEVYLFSFFNLGTRWGCAESYAACTGT